MPLKIGNSFVVSFHRSDAQKTVLPGDKERFREGLPLPALHPGKRSKPPVEISRITPYNRYPSASAVNLAMTDPALAAQVATPREVMQRVQAHLQAHRQRWGEPRLVILGEQHGYASALASMLTLLHGCGPGAVGTKKVLYELSPQVIDQAFPRDDAGLGYFRRRLQADKPLRFLPGMVAETEWKNVRTTGLYARHLGFEVHGFDTLATGAPHQERRENAMVSAISSAMTNARVVIVLTGAHHVPELCEKFSPALRPLALATMEPVARGDTDLTKRSSYLLSTPGILKMNPAPALENTPLDAVSFINHELR